MGASTIAFFFLLFQCVLGLIAIYRLDKGFYLQDIRLTFLIFFSLYALFWPAINYVFNIGPADDSYVMTILEYGLALVPFNIILLWKRIRWKNTYVIKYLPVRAKTCLALLTGLVVLDVLIMRSAGVPVFSFGGEMMARRDYFSAVTQIWVVGNYFITALLCALAFTFKDLTKQQKWFFVGLSIFYILFQLSLGNRREIGSFLLFCVLYYMVTKKLTVRLRIAIVLIILFIGSFAVSMLRDASTRDARGNEAVELAMQSNEFIYPIQTTYYIIHDHWEYRYGSTYVLLPIQTLIPRFIYPGKPQTLGGEFVSKTFGDDFMGFAYTPVTEAYLNGGTLSVLLVFTLFAIFLNRQVKQASTKMNFWYLIFISLAMDFCRGDFTSISYTLLMMWLCMQICRVGLKRPHRMHRRKGILISVHEKGYEKGAI